MDLAEYARYMKESAMYFEDVLADLYSRVDNLTEREKEFLARVQRRKLQNP